MNRLIVALLSVLIVLVAVHTFLEWRADERAEDEAELQTCIQQTQATATIALLVPSLIRPSEDLDRESQLQSLGALSTQLDAC
jgi:hypothetical protein